MSKEYISKRIRDLVAFRANFSCEYCCSQLEYSPDPFSVEHIVPRKLGGSSQEINLALACQGCNNHKFISTSGFDPVSNLEVELFNPRHAVWEDHFVWSDDYLHIIGITPTGRATVSKLQLNREGVVNLRQVLHTLGLHPPFQ